MGEVAGDQLSQLTLAGDVDGDGLPDLLVGSVGNDRGGTDAGAVYLIPATASGDRRVNATAIVYGATVREVSPPTR